MLSFSFSNSNSLLIPLRNILGTLFHMFCIILLFKSNFFQHKSFHICPAFIQILWCHFGTCERDTYGLHFRKYCLVTALTYSGPRTPYGGVISCSECFTPPYDVLRSSRSSHQWHHTAQKKIRVLFPSAAIRGEWKRPFVLAICALIVTSLWPKFTSTNRKIPNSMCWVVCSS